MGRIPIQFLGFPMLIAGAGPYVSRSPFKDLLKRESPISKRPAPIRCFSMVVPFFLFASSRVAGEKCAVSNIVLKCNERCAGVNVTSFASSTASHYLLSPSDGAQSSGGAPLEPAFVQLASKATRSGTTTESIPDAHEAEPLTPDQLIAFIGPVDQ